MRSLLLWIGIATGISAIAPRSSQAQVLINEFLAKNATTNPDMCDYDDFTDWIELYNSGSAQVDLSGYYLTGDLKKPTKWQIPSGTVIPAQGYLLFWADGYNNKPGAQATRPYYPFTLNFSTKRYHTNFKLDKDGEQVGLFKGSTLVDSVTFPAQLTDVSWGRNPSDNNKWYKYDQPTPGAANNSTAKLLTLTDYSPEVSFSVPGGFYSSAQTVTLTAPSGGTIYYTRNGSIPRANSAKYSSPISLSSTTVLRARCIDADRIAGPVKTNTYFINEKARTLAVVSLASDSAFLWDDVIGIYKNNYKYKEIPGSMEFITPDGKEAFQVNAGLGPGTLTSYDCPQMPWQISLESKYGSEIIDYPLFAKPFTTFKRLRLRNSGDVWATNYMSDNIVEALIKGQMNCATEAYRPVIVYLNGKYWGIYDLREQFDPLFFVHNWNVDTASLTMVKRSYAQVGEAFLLERGTWTDWNTMKSTAASGNYSNIQSVIDAPSFFDGVCMIHYAGCATWGHNVDFWKVAGSPWKKNIADWDRGFDYTNIAINLFTSGAGGSGTLTTKDTVFVNMVKLTEYKNLFVQRYAAHLCSTFKPERMVGIIDSIGKMLSPEMTDHANRWKADKGIQSLSAWQAEVDKMKKFGNERAAIALAQVQSQFSLSGTAQLTVNLSTTGAGDIYIAGVRMCSGTSGLNLFKSVPLTVKAVAKPGYAFVRWEGLGAADSVSVTLTGNQTITAVFQVAGTIEPVTVTASGNTLRLLARRHAMDGASELELEYAVPGKTPLSIALFSTSGKMVARLFKSEASAGSHRITVSAGHRPPGTYFLRMKSDLGAKVVKAILN